MPLLFPDHSFSGPVGSDGALRDGRGLLYSAGDDHDPDAEDEFCRRLLFVDYELCQSRAGADYDDSDQRLHALIQPDGRRLYRERALVAPDSPGGRDAL